MERVAGGVEGAAEVVRLLGVRRRTLVLRGGDECALGVALQIIDCHHCQIYCCAPVRTVELLGNSHSSILLGGVSRVVSARLCERVTLVAAAAAVRAHGLAECCLQLCVGSRPLLWGENRRLSLAPFGAVYTSLPQHLAAARLSPALQHNFWATPVLCARADAGRGGGGGGGGAGGVGGAAGAAAGGDADGAPFTLLPPSAYLPFHVPHDIPPAEEEAPPVVELPAEYASALESCVREMDAFSHQLAALQPSEGVRGEVTNLLQSRFKDWLLRTGNMRQITDLLAAEGA